MDKMRKDLVCARQLAQALVTKNQRLEAELAACHRCCAVLRRALDEQVQVTSDVWDRRGSDPREPRPRPPHTVNSSDSDGD